MTARDSKGRFVRKGRKGKGKSRRGKLRKASSGHTVTAKAVSLARKLLATVKHRAPKRRSKSRRRR